MKRVCCIAVALLFSSTFIFGQDSLQATIVLIGDAGKLTDGHHPVVSAVRSTIPLNAKTTIVYLGDNLYKAGLPDDATPTYQMAKAVLDSQVVVAKGTDAKVYSTKSVKRLKVERAF